MPTLNSRLIHLTNHKGQPLVPAEEMVEPERGSIVLVNGIFGTAWQRMFDTGRWCSTRGGTPRTWNQLISRREVVLVYDAPERN